MYVIMLDASKNLRPLTKSIIVNCSLSLLTRAVLHLLCTFSITGVALRNSLSDGVGASPSFFFFQMLNIVESFAPTF